MVKETICLTHEQVLNNLNNLSQIMKLPKLELKYEGKLKEYKTTLKLAECYELYECKNEFYFIVVYASNFNIQYFQACSYFEKMFHESVKTPERPKIYLCSAFTISKTNLKSLSMDILSVPFRFILIPSIHPLTGSKSLLQAHIMSYELLKTKDVAFNGKDFPLIMDSDPAVKLVNALPGELIRYKEVILDNGKPYTQYKIRRVVKTKSSIKEISNSGLANFDE